MNTVFDFAPLWRSSVGFDRLFDMLDQAGKWEPVDNYPPYNIEKTGDDAYRITLAVAGFTPGELSITSQPNLLVVNGKAETKGGSYLPHQGIAARAFRAALQPRRTRQGDGSPARERPVDHRARARGARGDEAAPDPDRDRHRAAAGDRA
jgi:hypothetical protein